MAPRAHPTGTPAAVPQVRPAPPPDTPRPHLRVDFETPISELVSYYGQKHIHFPKNLGQYYNLDSDKLDSLIIFFHQTYPPTRESSGDRYPPMIDSWLTYDSERKIWLTTSIDLESKRSRFGEFIGLKHELVDDKPKTPSDENPSGAGAVWKRVTRKGFFTRLGFGK
ncbi:unnamed protein product [Penicillium glandicola]